MKMGKPLFLILLLALCLTFCSRPVSELNAELLEAAQQGDTEAVKSLLKTKAELETTNKDGHTPLILATKGLHVEVVRLLLEAGADANAADPSGVTALIALTYKMFVDQNVLAEIAQLLIDAGADVNMVDGSNCTPLILAVDDELTKLVPLLIDAGADLNVQTVRGFTALMLAVRHNDAKVVKQLVDAGADVNIRNNEGYTALDPGGGKGSDLNEEDPIVKMLLEAGAIIDWDHASGIGYKEQTDLGVE